MPVCPAYRLILQSWASQIVHRVANGSPQLQHFFERAVTRRWAPQTRYTFRRNTASTMKLLIWFWHSSLQFMSFIVQLMLLGAVSAWDKTTRVQKLFAYLKQFVGSINRVRHLFYDDLDRETLYDDYLCLVALNKQLIQWTRIQRNPEKHWISRNS